MMTIVLVKNLSGAPQQLAYLPGGLGGTFIAKETFDENETWVGQNNKL